MNILKLQFFILFVIISFNLYPQKFNCVDRIDVDSILKKGLKGDFFQTGKITDECKLAFIDEVSAKFMLSRNVSYIKLLGKLFSYSDASYTDNVCFNASKIFDSCLSEWFEYLYLNKKGSCDSKLFIHCISIKMGGNKQEEENCNKALDGLAVKMSVSKRKFLNSLRKQLNPHIQD